MRARHLTGVDASTRFVRVTGTTRGGFVEFQFSIGDPSLYLEMILPPSAFEAWFVSGAHTDDDLAVIADAAPRAAAAARAARAARS